MTALDDEEREAPAGRSRLEHGLAWLYVLGGFAGLAAAVALTLEDIAKLRAPGYVPTCSLNPVISCGSVMESTQAQVFGFPNPLLGVGAFAVVMTVGVVLLSGYVAPRWFWLGLQLGATLGVVFVHWLIYSSLYSIGALCPYCMAVWAVTIPMFSYTTLHNVEHGHLPGGQTRVALLLTRLHSVVLAVWYVVIAALILQAFWSFWTS